MSAAPVRHDDLFGLGDRLAKARKRAQIPAGVMAEILGVHRNSISNYENGHQVPSRGTVITWAVVTQQPVSWLLGSDYPELSERATALLSGDGESLASICCQTEVATLLVLASPRQQFALDAAVTFRSERLIQRAS